MKMNVFQHCLVSLSLIVFTFSEIYSSAERINLIPDPPAKTANYWCTWYAQNYWIGRGEDLSDLSGVTNQNAREELNDHTLFNEKDGWASTYLKRGRRDFVFLIDHGWQTKVAEERIAGGAPFFNLVADPRDFPRYAEMEPKERIRKMNDEIKALGWNSLGLWTRGNVTLEEARTFVEWSKHAGITYWKIDGGDTDQFNSFKAKEEIYPELILEYVTGAGGNINPGWDRDLDSYPSVYDVGGNLRDKMLKVLRHTDTFRTYDASPLLMSVTTLRRTHDILKQTLQQPEYRAVLNVQDDCNIAVGLGVLVASKRHPNMNERTLEGKDLHHQLSGPRKMQKRINEVERFGRWARLAPAFPAGEGVYVFSENELIDRCEFTRWDTWAKNTYGKMVSQSAPAIMARNAPLPQVECDGPPPYVCVTTYPNGPTGIATEGRVSPSNRWFEPRARVTVRIRDAAQPIGVVGHYETLVLKFAGSVENVRHIWAQDLLADQAVDIKSRALIEGSTITIPGKVIDEIGTAAGDAGDISAPGMVLLLEGEDLPVAGDDYLPEATPVTEATPVISAKQQSADGFFGDAKLIKAPYGYKVTASAKRQLTLRKTKNSITSGKLSVRWKMKPANNASTRNGLIILSADEDANAAICAGAWFGSNQMTLFENDSSWGNDQNQPCEISGELECELAVDLDARKAVLTINGRTMDLDFTESFTSVSYVGFGVHNADTLFTVPEIVLNGD